MTILGFVLVSFGILMVWSGFMRVSVLTVMQSLFAIPQGVKKA